MKMLRIVAAGTLSYFAYRAWKRDGETRKTLSSRAGASLPDDGSRNAAHGDPVLDLDEADAASVPRAGTHPPAGSSVG